MAIAALLFDVMGTLVYDPFYEEVPAFFGMTMEELLADKHPSAWVSFEKGELTEEAFLRIFFADERAYDQAGLVACMRDAYRWLDGMESLLQALQAGGTPMYLLSNYPVWYRLIEARLGLSRYASWRFVSCEMGVRKPDALVFEQVVGALDLAPGELAFVDDRRGNCEAAARAGLVALHFRDAETLRRDLRGLGVLPGSA